MAANEKEELLKLVKNTLRSVLIPNKEGIPARTISKVYNELACSSLPYRQLGYSTCEEFIKSIPDVVRIGRNQFGEPQLFAVATAATAHIVKMVKAQRNRKVRSKRPVRTPVRRPYNQKPGPPPRVNQSRYGYGYSYPSRPYSQGSAYSRPPSRPVGKPFSKPIRPAGTAGRPFYNNTAPVSRPSQPLYKINNGSSGPPYKDFAVTVQNSRRGLTVELKYDSDELESETESAQKGRMKSVVVKPSVLSTAKPRPLNPPSDEVKFGENYEVPPRFRQSRGGRGEKDNDLPSVVERGHMYKKLVTDYCKHKGLPSPNYDLIPMKKGCVCTLHLEGRTYGSLEPYQNRESAEEAAAMNACKSLDIEKGLSNLVNSKTEDEIQLSTFDPKVKDRIAQILRSKPNGVWLKRIPVEYKQKHKEEVPGNLLTLLKSWTELVKLEKNEHADTYIVYYASPKADIPMPALFPLREKVAVFMSYLSEDGQFYVQRSDTEIDNINEDIQSLSESASRIPGPELTQGVFCVAMYGADNTWCRAKVLQYIPGTNVVDVLFVDYGNEEQIPLQMIRKLNPKLSTTPAQCVKCELYGVKAWEGDLWNEAAIDKFAELSGNIELLALTISHTGKMCEVELFTSPEETESLNEVMVKKGLLQATAQKYLSITPDIPEVKEEDTSKTEDVTKEEEQKMTEASNATTTLGEPGPIIFPEERYWNIYVSFLTSINDITFRLVGESYSDRLEELEISLEECYKTSDSSGEIAEGSVCVANVDDLYHRVRVLDLKDKLAKCFFLDHGDTDEMEIKKLKLISPEYNTLPYQACHCGLAGLDVSNESVTASALESLLNYVLGKTCVAEIVTSYGRHHSVILYDTSGDEDVNINDAIAKLTAEENLKFQTSRESTFCDTESMSSESSSTSEFSVTLKPKILTKSKQNSESANPTASVDSPSLLASDSYLSEFSDGFLDLQQSCQLNLDSSINQPESIDPTLLDQFSQGVNMESIVGTTLSPVLSQDKMSSPASSMEGRSSPRPEDIPLPESCSELSSMSDLDSGMPARPLWGGKQPCNVGQATPSVSNITNGLQSMDIWAQGDGAFPVNVDIWSKAYLDLPVPPFFQPPPVGQYIDVHVRWISDPENFVCLPYASLNVFANFMEKLDECFKSNPPVRQLGSDDVKVGHLYAGYQCEKWYRVIVKDYLQESDTACILMADVGEFDVMELKDLQPLPLQFWGFPFQSIRAKLFGASSNTKQWSEACKFKFQELVANKNLVAMVKGKDETTGVYSLSLVDTSREDLDIDINEVFTSKLISWLDS